MFEKFYDFYLSLIAVFKKPPHNRRLPLLVTYLKIKATTISIHHVNRWYVISAADITLDSVEQNNSVSAQQHASSQQAIVRFFKKGK